MTKKTLVWLLVAFFVVNLSVAQAQQATKIPRIGYLIGSFLTANAARIEAFRQGLRELKKESNTEQNISGATLCFAIRQSESQKRNALDWHNFPYSATL